MKLFLSMRFLTISCLIVVTFCGFSQEDFDRDWSFEELDSLIFQSKELGKLDESMRFAELLTGKAEKANSDSLRARGLEYQGIIYRLRAQYKESVAFLTKAMNIRKRSIGTENTAYANSLFNIAVLQMELGNYSDALDGMLRAKEIRKKILGDKHAEYAESLNSLGSLYKEIGSYDQALSMYEQTKEIDALVYGTDHPYYAITLNNIGGVYQDLGNLEKAQTFFKQALAIKEKVYGKVHPSYAISLNNLAMVYQLNGDFHKAKELHLETESIKKKVYGKRHPSYAITLNNLAQAYQDLGELDKSLYYFLQALEIDEAIYGKEHISYATTLNNVGVIYSKLSEYNKSYKAYDEARKVIARAVDESHWLNAKALNNLASISFLMGNYDESWRVVEQTIHSATQSRHPLAIDKAWVDQFLKIDFKTYLHLDEMIRSLNTIYRLLEADETIDDALEKQELVADLANSLLITVRNQVSGEQDKLRVLAMSHEWLRRSLQILNGDRNAEKAFRLADQNKSALLLEATKSEAAYRLGEIPDSIVWQSKELFRAESLLKAKLLEKSNSEHQKDSLRSNLIGAQHDIDQFTAKLEKNYPKYYKLKYGQEYVGVLEVQKLISENAAMLSYIVTDSLIHVFYIDKQNVQWVKVDVTEQELNERINKFHGVLTDFQISPLNAEYTKNAYWFYEKLIAAPLSDKPNIDELIVVTGGNLGHLPFEAFLTEYPGDDFYDSRNLSYLINHFSVSYNYSAALWCENMESKLSNNNGEVFAMAGNYDIAFDTSSQYVRLPTHQATRSGLAPLPSSRKEVEALQEKFEGFYAFDENASEKEIKKFASEYSILHFATHGVLNSERPILSSLVLTEDSDSLESNFWEAHEISRANLKADLAVLAACETGYGKFQKGNGVASLARAFMYAGVPALVVSLWKINDNSTSDLIQFFYENLDQGMQKNEALRQAKLKYIATSSDSTLSPAYWAPFIMIGNTHAIDIKRRSSPVIWIGIVSIGILVIFLIYFKSRK